MNKLSLSPDFIGMNLPQAQDLGILLSGAQASPGISSGSTRGLSADKDKSKDSGDVSMTPDDAFNYKYQKQLLDLERRNFMTNLWNQAKESGDPMTYILKGKGRQLISEYDNSYAFRKTKLESLKPSLEKRFTDINTMIDDLRKRNVSEANQWYDDDGNPVEGVSVGHKIYEAINSSNIDATGSVTAMNPIVVENMTRFWDRYNVFMDSIAKDASGTVTQTTGGDYPLDTDNNGNYVIGKQSVRNKTTYPVKLSVDKKGNTTESRTLYANKEQLDAAFGAFLDEVKNDREMAKAYNIIVRRIEEDMDISPDDTEAYNEGLRKAFTDKFFVKKLVSGYKRESSNIKDLSYRGGTSGEGTATGAPTSILGLIANVDKLALDPFKSNYNFMDQGSTIVVPEIASYLDVDPKTEARMSALGYAFDAINTDIMNPGKEYPEGWDLFSSMKRQWGDKLSDAEINMMIKEAGDAQLTAMRLEGEYTKENPMYADKAKKDFYTKARNDMIFNQVSTDKKNDYLEKYGQIYESKYLSFNPSEGSYDIIIDGTNIRKVDISEVKPGFKINLREEVNNYNDEKIKFNKANNLPEDQGIINLDFWTNTGLKSKEVTIEDFDSGNWNNFNPLFMIKDTHAYAMKYPVVPIRKDKWKDSMSIYGASLNNMDNIYLDLKHPINVGELLNDTKGKIIVRNISSILPFAETKQGNIPMVQAEVLVPKDIAKKLKYPIESMKDGNITTSMVDIKNYDNKFLGEDGELKDLTNDYIRGRANVSDSELKDDYVVVKMMVPYNDIYLDMLEDDANVDIDPKYFSWIQEKVNNITRQKDEQTIIR